MYSGENISFLELTPGSCTADTDAGINEPGVLSPEDMATRDMVQLCWYAHSEQPMASKSEVESVGDVTRMFTNLRILKADCRRSGRSSCTFKDKVDLYSGRTGDTYSAYLNDTNPTLPQASHDVNRKRHDMAERLKADHDLAYHSHQPVMDEDPDTSPDDKDYHWNPKAWVYGCLSGSVAALVGRGKLWETFAGGSKESEQSLIELALTLDLESGRDSQQGLV